MQRNANLVDFEKRCKMRLYAPLGAKNSYSYFPAQKKSFGSRWRKRQASSILLQGSGTRDDHVIMSSCRNHVIMSSCHHVIMSSCYHVIMHVIDIHFHVKKKISPALRNSVFLRCPCVLERTRRSSSCLHDIELKVEF